MIPLRTLLSFSAIAFTIVSAQGFPASQCNTRPVQCCLSVGYSSSPQIAKVLDYLHIVVQDVTTLIGATCSEISVVGLGSGATCNAIALCCENNNYGGIVSIGCAPVNLNL